MSNLTRIKLALFALALFLLAGCQATPLALSVIPTGIPAVLPTTPPTATQPPLPGGTPRPTRTPLPTITPTPVPADVPISSAATPITAENAGRAQLLGVLSGNGAGPFLSVAFSPSGQLLAAGLADGTVHLWRIPSGHAVSTWNGQAGPPWGVSFSSDGVTLAAALGRTYDKNRNLIPGTVRLWDAKGEQSSLPKEYAGDVYSVAFSPDGTLLAAGTCTKRGEPPSEEISKDDLLWCNTGQIWLWSVGTTQGQRLEVGRWAVVSVAFSPGGKLLADGEEDGTIRLWDVTAGTEIMHWAGHEGSIGRLTFSPDRALLASTGEYDGRVRLWEPATGREIRALVDQEEGVLDTAFSPDGRLLVTASWDGSLHLWDTATGQAVATLSGHTAGVLGVAFSPTGVSIASASADGTVRFWGIP